MKYKIKDMSPVFYSIFPFNYISSSNVYKRIKNVKNQYVYRYLYFTKGVANIKIEKENIICSEGSVLYLVPGQEYRVITSDDDFSLINLFFDFFPYTGAERNGRDSYCIFKNDFDKKLCSQTDLFSDATVFNSFHHFKNTDCKHDFEEILHANNNGLYYDLYVKSALTAITSTLLKTEFNENNPRAKTAEKIISYINMNVDKKISAENLSRIFGYHPNHINYLIKGHTGFTLGEYIRKSKIKYAKILLAESEMTASQVAAELGYYDYSHFYKAFLTEAGSPPASYAKNK